MCLGLIPNARGYGASRRANTHNQRLRNTTPANHHTGAQALPAGRSICQSACWPAPDPPSLLPSALHRPLPCLSACHPNATQARALRSELLSPEGDALSLLQVFEAWLEFKAQHGGASSASWCRQAGTPECTASLNAAGLELNDRWHMLWHD